MASISTMNSQVARRKEASAGGIIRPLLTYALLSFLPPAKESTSSLKERDARARASDPASAAASDLRPGQQGRAKQSGRGRHATSPWQIPWAGWKDILWRTYGQIGDDRLLAVAAGVVFYGLLAIFPAVTAFVSLYGLFAKASTISDHLALAAGVIPSGGVEIIQEQINRITAKGDARLSLAFAFSLGLALWSANAGMKAVIDALNVTYNEKEKRGFIKLNLISLALTVRCNSFASCSPRINRGAASDPLLFWTRRMDRDTPAISPLARADLPRRIRSGRFVSIRSK